MRATHKHHPTHASTVVVLARPYCMCGAEPIRADCSSPIPSGWSCVPRFDWDALRAVRDEHGDVGHTDAVVLCVDRHHRPVCVKNKSAVQSSLRNVERGKIACPSVGEGESDISVTPFFPRHRSRNVVASRNIEVLDSKKRAGADSNVPTASSHKIFDRRHAHRPDGSGLCRATTTRKEDDIVRCSREVVLDVAGAEIDRPNVGSWSVQHCNRVGPCPCGGAVADKDRHSDHPRRPCAGAHTGSLSRAVGLARSRVKVHPLCVAVEVAPCWHLASEWVEWVHRLSAVGERLCPLTANGLGGRSGASLKCRAAASRNQDDGSGRSQKWPPTLTQRRRRPLCQHCQQDGPHNRHHLRVSEAWTVRTW
eukprot:m.68225 g.68225  ORF g.68225 m.68225 type:complete len:365 (+) comp18298_c0_seq1:238-1332(+)